MRELHYLGKGKTAFFRHGLSPLLRLGVATHLLSPGILDNFGSRPLAGPFAVGHECVAQVIEIGEAVRHASQF
jgi:alcohol dehydrogenase